MRIGVFGGTFNPIHFGHLRVAEDVLETLSLQKMIFVPAGTPPLKAEGLASATDRMRMVEMAVEGNPAFEVSPVEIEREGISYTIDTLRFMKELYPGAELFFILGIDAFREIGKWKHIGELLSTASFVVIGRPPYSFASLRGSPSLTCSEESLIELDDGGILSLDGDVSFLRVTPMEISATDIRQRLRDGRSVRYLLPENVESFIINNALYIRHN
ncbi:nicotinate-nucleotide adenylyltransferase [Nitrospirota bacterium]